MTAYPKKDLLTKEKINGRYLQCKSSGPRVDGMPQLFKENLLPNLMCPFFRTGLTAKLRNMIPFYRPKLVTESDFPDVVNNLILEESHKMNLVPNIEVTPANNHQLINKYKQLHAAVKSDKSAALIEEALPKVPLRRRSVNQ